MKYEDFVKELRKLIVKRASLPMEWDDGIYSVQKEWTKLCSENIEHLIRFLDEDSTDDEYGWLSEVYEDIAEVNPNREFVASLYRAAKKFPEETKNSNVMSFIEGADDIVEYCLDPDRQE